MPLVHVAPVYKTRIINKPVKPEDAHVDRKHLFFITVCSMPQFK